MPSSQRPQINKRAGAKVLLNGMKMTTAIGAVGLTLAGWGVLAQAETTSTALADEVDVLLPIVSSPEPVGPGRSSATTGADTITATPIARAVPAQPTAETTSQVKLDVVQWVQSTAGDPVAVVRDAKGMLWYVWGSDVPLIEQGLAPQYPPQPVNRRGRSRSS